jgi:hypothetical protein
MIDRVKTYKLRERELKLALFTEKKQTYLALTDAACAIAACQTYEDVKKASSEFIKIYYGRAHAIVDLDGPVYDAKVAFYEELVTYLSKEPENSPDAYFNVPAQRITAACKPSIDPRILK